MKDLVSVIIPVYNSEKYLRECLDSVLAQDYAPVEIICVDDGSTDSSRQIIEEYPDVRYYYQENHGQGTARNYGITQAHGEWLVFCDSDDYLDKDYLSSMMEQATEDIDMVCCNIRRIVDGTVNEDHFHVEGVIDVRTALINLNPGPTNKLYRRKIFDHVRFFEERKRYEDLAVFPATVVACNKIHVIRKCLYNYRIYENSTMRKWDERINDIFDICDYIISREYVDEYREEISYLIFKHALFGHISRVAYFSLKQMMQEYRKAGKYVLDKVPDYWKNSYIRQDHTPYFYVGVRLFKLHLFPLLFPPLKLVEKRIGR